jgi:tRNA threonylcarbamoyladenosine biosynthesis protein TsaE
MATCISHSPAETEAVGQVWGRAASRGWVIGLSGDLGAGKTCLVKGLARGLEITERVQSPSFALVNIYTSGRIPLFHLDLYRLDTIEQILGAGLEEYLRPGGVTVVEWVEKWMKAVPARTQQGLDTGRPESVVAAGARLPLEGLSGPFRWVHLETLDETQRRITYEDFGT